MLFLLQYVGTFLKKCSCYKRTNYSKSINFVTNLIFLIYCQYNWYSVLLSGTPDGTWFHNFLPEMDGHQSPLKLFFEFLLRSTELICFFWSDVTNARKIIILDLNYTPYHISAGTSTFSVYSAHITSVWRSRQCYEMSLTRISWK
jgi:hypothetical protein